MNNLLTGWSSDEPIIMSNEASILEAAQLERLEHRYQTLVSSYPRCEIAGGLAFTLNRPAFQWEESIHLSRAYKKLDSASYRGIRPGDIVVIWGAIFSNDLTASYRKVAKVGEGCVALEYPLIWDFPTESVVCRPSQIVRTDDLQTATKFATSEGCFAPNVRRARWA